MESKQNTYANLPPIVQDYIDRIIRKMGYRRSVRQDVHLELTTYFQDALRECPDMQARQQRAEQLIGEFGDPLLLAKLIRRGKIRCRPLWRTAVVRAFQSIGAVIVLLIVYVVWFMAGRPTVRVDYVAMLNDKARPQIAETDNAWAHYEKAIHLFVPAPESMVEIKGQYRRLDASGQAIIRQWVEQNDAAWVEVTAAAGKSYCYRPYRLGDNDKQGMMLGILLTHLNSIRDLAKLGSWRSQVELEAGKTETAIETSLTVIRCGRQWLTQVTLIEHLVGTAMVTMGNEQILDILAVHPLEKAGLAELRQQLDQIWIAGYPPLTFEYERMMFMDVVQHSFTEGGPGGGHLMPTMVSLLNYSDEIPPIVACSISLIHAGRAETVKMGNTIYQAMEETIAYSPYQRKAKRIQGSESIVENLPKYRYSLFHSLVPALTKATDRYYEGRAFMEATRTIVAIQLYKSEKDNWPENLGELKAAGMIPTIPMDPYGDGAMVYQRRGDSVIVYSRGTDMEDDGGRSVVGDPWGRNTGGQSNTPGPDGDWVFWPPQ